VQFEINAIMLVVLFSLFLGVSSFQLSYFNNHFLIQKKRISDCSRSIISCTKESVEKDLIPYNDDIVLYTGPEAHFDDMEAGCSIENLGMHIYKSIHICMYIYVYINMHLFIDA
jgi:hypothetical protein